MDILVIIDMSKNGFSVKLVLMVNETFVLSVKLDVLGSGLVLGANGYKNKYSSYQSLFVIPSYILLLVNCLCVHVILQIWNKISLFVKCCK